MIKINADSQSKIFDNEDIAKKATQEYVKQLIPSADKQGIKITGVFQYKYYTADKKIAYSFFAMGYMPHDKEDLQVYANIYKDLYERHIEEYNKKL